MPERKMEGQRVLVTGAGTGIGQGVARELARQGATVALHYAQTSEHAVETVEAIRADGGTAESFLVDFADLDATQQLARDALDFLGGIDLLINNAGVTFSRSLLDTTPQQYEMVFAVNLRAMFFLIQGVVPAMRDQGKGSVISLTSGHAFQGRALHAVYAATKGAIVALTRQLAVELGPMGIRVNAIAPGCIPTENYAPDYDLDGVAWRLPVGHVGTPTDIAALAMFLACDDSRFITGQTHVIDGGQLAVMGMSDDFRRPVRSARGDRYVPEP